MDSQSIVQAAKFVSTTGSLLVAGYCLGFSQNGISELYDERPQISTPIFKRIFYTGGRCAAPLSIASLISSIYLAYTIPEKRRLWLTAAGLVLGIRFWTDVVMMPGIQRLVAISEDKALQDKSEQTLEHRQLLISWVKHNYLRTTAALASGVLAFLASTT